MKSQFPPAAHVAGPSPTALLPLAETALFLTAQPRIAISMPYAGLGVRVLFDGLPKPLKTQNNRLKEAGPDEVRAPGTNTRTERCSQSSKPAANSTALRRRT